MKADLIPEAGLDDELLAGRRWIDVRAPVEFARGHLPGAVNLPILNDDERARVGTAYKQEGPQAAVALGHALVHGAVKEARVRGWRELVEREGAAVYCFRGGLRSQIARQWLGEAGCPAPLLEGGYKAARARLLRLVEGAGASLPYLVVTGPSGAGKTELLRAVADHRSVLDLEEAARHRGSAFGGFDEPQPAQAVFENALALQLLRCERRGDERAVLVEDESWMIGQCRVPAPVYHRMTASPMIAIEEELDARTERVLNEYVRGGDPARLYAGFRDAVRAISKRLGGARAQELLHDLDAAERALRERGDRAPNREWIRKLLTWYYDPFYRKHLEAGADRIVFRGDFRACRDYLRAK